MMVAAVAAASLVLVGCSSSGGRTVETVDSGDQIVMTPAATTDLDRASWNLPHGEPASLDPIKGFNYPENTVVANLCEGLFQLQPDFTIKPHLAKSVEVIDGTTHVYEIQEGVTFWDGTPMTTEDVVFSLKRSLNPEEGSYWASDVTDNIVSVEKTGDNQVTIELERADATFNDQLATPIGVVVQQKHREAAGADYGNPSAGVMCTGPFSVGDWKQGTSITLEKFDGYWKSDAQAKTKQVEINFIVDPTSIANALSTGAIDGSYDVPMSAISKLRDSDSGTLYYGKTLMVMAFISTGDGTFGDPAVRRALWMATDTSAIGDTVYEGIADAAVSLIPDGGWSYGDKVFSEARANLTSPEVDIEGAKEVLKSATADLTQPIKIVYPSERSFYADIISEFANAGKELGLTVEPTGIPSAQFGAFFSDPQARAGSDAFITTNYMSIPDPLSYLASIAKTNGSQNYADFSNPEIDALITEAQMTEDADERAELVVKAEEAIMDKLPWLPVVNPSVLLYMNEKVTGVPASFVYLYYPWAAHLGGTGK